MKIKYSLLYTTLCLYLLVGNQAHKKTCLRRFFRGVTQSHQLWCIEVGGFVAVNTHVPICCQAGFGQAVGFKEMLYLAALAMCFKAWQVGPDFVKGNSKAFAFCKRAGDMPGYDILQAAVFPQGVWFQALQHFKQLICLTCFWLKLGNAIYFF